MIVPIQDIIESLGVSSNTQIIDSKHKAIEQRVKNWMQWDPESVTHTGKLYDGTGYPELFLKEEHIQRVTRVATGATAAISIKNTSTDATNAFAEVTATALRLVVEGGANADDTNTLFADYATIALMVAQINTIGKGWTAEVYDSDFNDYLSTNLFQTDGFYVGSWEGNTAQFDYLLMADEPVHFTINKENGMIKRRSGSFPEGDQNIAVNYVSGWTRATMPEDLKDGVKALVKLRYNKDADGTEGLKSYTVDGVTEVFDTGSVSNTSADYDIDRLIPSKYRKRVLA